MENKNSKDIKIIILTILSEYFNVVALVFMILILTLGFFFVISPKRESIYTDLKKINDDKLVEKGELEDLKRKISVYVRSYKQTNEIGRKKIDKMLPKEAREGEIMVQLEELARKKGLLLSSVSVIPRVKKKSVSRGGLKGKIEELPVGINAVDILFSVQGINYESMKNLLSEFENNLRLMDVVKLGFSPGGNSLDFEVVAYYSK